jgi:hypothetical protein
MEYNLKASAFFSQANKMNDDTPKNVVPFPQASDKDLLMQDAMRLYKAFMCIAHHADRMKVITVAESLAPIPPNFERLG